MIIKWEARLITHEKQSRIGVYFEKDALLIERIKKIDGARWSQSKKVWHLPDTPENRLRFKIDVPLPNIPSEEGIECIKKFSQWLSSKRYSPNTIKTYTEALKSFFVFYRDKPVTSLTNENVVLYNNDYILKKKSLGFLPEPDCECH